MSLFSMYPGVSHMAEYHKRAKALAPKTNPFISAERQAWSVKYLFLESVFHSTITFVELRFLGNIS